MIHPKLKFYYGNSVNLTVTDKTFKKAIDFVFNAPGLNTHTPIKMVAESTGKVFFFDDELFKLYLAGELPQIDLLAKTECDGLYRNIHDINLSQTDTIDKGSLFILKDKKYRLVDKDRELHFIYPDSNFIEI